MNKKKNVPVNTGAIPALRGYRKQFLFTLGRILRSNNEVYYPEHIEDFSVYDDKGHLIEIAQVKDHSSPLAFSDLKTFLKRASDEIKKHPNLVISLATYGTLGDELSRVLQTKEVKADSKFSSVAPAIQRLQVIHLNESREHQQIMDCLSKHPMMSGDTKAAFDILMQSLYIGSERGHSFTKQGVNEHLIQIGTYLVAREAHHKEWGTSILPLIESTHPKPERLRKEFSQGVGARWEHITAGTDVERTEYLSRVQEGFTKHNITIIHGASGQGKSTLAYRYLFNFCPSTMRYEIRDVSSRERALQIATALRGYGAGLAVPITFYADVSFTDKGIEELIRQIVEMPHVRLLLSIREEDWRLISLSKAETPFAEVTMEFSEIDARTVFDSVSNNFPDFSQAWSKFGEGGPLLEFVYLLNHTETLHDRLHKQYNRIADSDRSNDLAIMETVALAGSCGARIDLRKLRERYPPTIIQQSIKRLESEYLVREGGNGTWLTGLHPIRSSALVNIFTDPVIKSWEESALTCISLLNDDDYELFLLHAFLLHPETDETLCQYLRANQLSSWKASGGVTRALIWKGVHSFIQSNQALINEVREVVGDGVWLLLDFDLIETMDRESPWEGIASLLPEDGKERARKWLAQQRPKSEAFSALTAWLGATQFPAGKCQDENDWLALGEVLYWASANKLGHRLTGVLSWVVTSKADEQLTLQTLGTLIYGLWHAFSDDPNFQKWYGAIRPTLISRYKQETLTPSIEINESLIRAHFIVPAMEYSDEEEVNLHQQGIEHAELLALLFPGFERYGCQGYGHMLLDFLEYDETTKTGIQATYLRPDWVVLPNKVARILSGFGSRPKTWRSYCDQMTATREIAVRFLSKLRVELSKHFRSKKVVRSVDAFVNSPFWQDASKVIARSPSFPLEALDPWGFTEERGSKNQSDVQTHSQKLKAVKSAAHLHQYADYLKAKSDYLGGLSNFINQSPSFLEVNSYMGKAKSIHEKSALADTANTLGINLTKPFLPGFYLFEALQALPRFQKLYRKHFIRLSSQENLKKIEDEETSELYSVWCLWNAFITDPSSHWSMPKKAVVNRFEQEIANVRKAIDTELFEISSSDITIGCLNTISSYENEPVLWISVDGENPVDVFVQLENIYHALQRAIGEPELHSLRYYAIQRMFSRVIIVPLVSGKMLEPWGWVLDSYKFTPNLESNRSLSQLDQAMRPIDEKKLSEAGLEIWKHPQIETAMSLFKNMVAVMTQLKHMIQNAQVPDLDEASQNVVQTYLTKHQQSTSDHFQSMHNEVKLLEELFHQEALTSADSPAFEYLEEAYSLISEAQDDLVPPNFANGKAELSIEDMEEWEKMLKGALDNVLASSLYWSAYLIQSQTTLRRGEIK